MKLKVAYITLTPNKVKPGASMDAHIANIVSREILDSRGNPTIEVEVHTVSGQVGRAAVPSGASTGKKEALELRDGDTRRFLGKGVLKACQHAREDISKLLRGKDVREQSTLDTLMLEADGTENKSRFGANAMLGVSMACARAAAAYQHKPLYQWLGELSGKQAFTLPTPLMNVINGGAHADNALDFQEFMLVPHGFNTFSEALRAGAECFAHLKQILSHAQLSTNVGDEGGFAPNISSLEQAIELLLQAIDRAGYRAGQDISLALDVAASEFYQDGKYVFKKSDQRTLSGRDMIALYGQLIEKYPIVSIEDPLDEDDWDTWQLLTQKLGDRCQWVGDDLFVTHPKLLAQGIDQKSANAILIKVNQIGTLSETLDTIALAQKERWGCVISHRSGETEDTFIADLAVGTAAGQIKTGSLSRADRTAKYNQLLRIEAMLGDRAIYAKSTPIIEA